MYSFSYLFSYMKKIQQLGKDFGKSLYDFEWIALQRGTGFRGIRVLLALGGVIFVLFSIFVGYHLTNFFADTKKEVESLPEFTASFEGKMLRVDGLEQPFVKRYWEEFGGAFVLHVDTQSDVFGASKDHQQQPEDLVVSIGKDRISVFDSTQKKEETFWFTEGVDSFTKEDVVGVLTKLQGFYGYVSAVLISLFATTLLLLWKLLYLSFLTFFAFLYNRLSKKGWSYLELYSVGLYAIICPSLIMIGLAFFALHIPYGYSVLVYLFFYMILQKESAGNVHGHMRKGSVSTDDSLEKKD